MNENISDLVGKVPVIIWGMRQYSEKVKILFSDFTVLELEHYQTCCERVVLEEIIGDIKDLIGSPLRIAEESSTCNVPSEEQMDESNTITFYKFVTMNGPVTLRWLGSSNGFYSESVDISIYKLENLDFLSIEEKVTWDSILEKL
jgi:hypothetical protein